MPVFVLTLLLLLLPASAAAQVYKCKGKSGETAYSEHPCDANTQPMKLRNEPSGGTAAPASSSGAEAIDEPAPHSDSSAGRDDEGDRAAERACIATATASVYGPSNDRVGNLQQQLSALNEQLAATADPQRSQALRTRMGTLRQAITREHATAHTQMNTARRRCIEQHRPAS